jgi:hypothetical protein
MKTPLSVHLLQNNRWLQKLPLQIFVTFLNDKFCTSNEGNKTTAKPPFKNPVYRKNQFLTFASLKQSAYHGKDI